jgi:hypothetical protein
MTTVPRRLKSCPGSADPGDLPSETGEPVPALGGRSTGRRRSGGEGTREDCGTGGSNHVHFGKDRYGNRARKIDGRRLDRGVAKCAGVPVCCRAVVMKRTGAQAQDQNENQDCSRQRTPVAVTAFACQRSMVRRRPARAAGKSREGCETTDGRAIQPVAGPVTFQTAAAGDAPSSE